MARYHDIWVLTRTLFQPSIEAELARNPQNGIQFIYWDLPAWAAERGRRGAHLHHYVWQLGVLRTARKLHAEIGFDLVHHVTLGRYWAPSFLCFLDVPFVWGPVGGGESAPKTFWLSGGWWNFLFEASREIARWAGERGPFVRVTAHRNAIALGTTTESAARLRALGCRRVQVVPQNGLLDSELEQLGSIRRERRAAIRFLSVGVLINWKGFGIGLRAFSKANIEDAEYWLIGGGPDRRRLENLAKSLGIAHRVRFFGWLPREEVFSHLRDCDVLLHPSLHDSGGTVTLEAMAAGMPVLCVDRGGPAMQVTEDCGFVIPARHPEQTIRDIAAAMTELALNVELRNRLATKARERAVQFRWSRRASLFNEIYNELASRNRQQMRAFSITEFWDAQAGPDTESAPSRLCLGVGSKSKPGAT
jgi:glycosyltransferase involved in cell wall biosynthesis